MATSKKQRVREAIVALLDTHNAITTITTRPNGNVVPWKDLNDATTRPILAYHVVAFTKIGGIGDPRRALVQFTAAANDEATANELIAAVDATLTTIGLAGLAAPLDAIRRPLDEMERSPDADLVQDSAERADLDVVLEIDF